VKRLTSPVEDKTQEAAYGASPLETPVRVDKRGFMTDLSHWTPAVALYLARRQGLEDWPYELTGRHWRVIEYLRAYYQATGNAPSLRFTCKALGLTKKQFSRLFPGGLMTARRISGLPGSRKSAKRGELSAAQQLLTGNWWERLTAPVVEDEPAGRTGRLLVPAPVAKPRQTTRERQRSARPSVSPA